MLYLRQFMQKGHPEPATWSLPENRRTHKSQINSPSENDITFTFNKRLICSAVLGKIFSPSRCPDAFQPPPCFLRVNHSAKVFSDFFELYHKFPKTQFQRRSRATPGNFEKRDHERRWKPPSRTALSAVQWSKHEPANHSVLIVQWHAPSTFIL